MSLRLRDRLRDRIAVGQAIGFGITAGGFGAFGPLPWSAFVAAPITAVLVFSVAARPVEGTSSVHGTNLKWDEVHETILTWERFVPKSDPARPYAERALVLAGEFEVLVLTRRLKISQMDSGNEGDNAERYLQEYTEHVTKRIDEFRSGGGAPENAADWHILEERLSAACKLLRDD